ncbi:PREDICTED: secreted frizzled-related protein 3-like [Priapulus caudatus]|uniref:Secreted frizzled-related protein 3-like n=1 Tax=Priapulus caudatus TaxID=37621 RepID=A0ABM1E8H5_PRICU|nr:PREDICTED: secreted frizzled-related protein 3-like [Priapulus caudatus]XP_014668495.1 PREDICTED: secreted frizzled-related protein 3-like [Priapulus caudatus]XP_014668496.1 PREDICTED: secreted frizzled-related protein 3-like [Priapulus caudatus]
MTRTSATLALCVVAMATLTRAGLQCESIKIPMCRSMPYNMTRMPNLLHHSTQENAILAIDRFYMLVQTKCSEHLLFFLCAIYAPICTLEFQAVPPCRGVCESARAGCEPLLTRYGLTWPENLDCDLLELPQYDRGVCIAPEAIVSNIPASSFKKLDGPDPTPPIISNNTVCSCGRSAKPRRTLYLKQKYQYVLRATLNTSETLGLLTLTTVKVSLVIKRSQVDIDPNTTTYLWTDDMCLCPALRPGREYLIMGHEDMSRSRLLFSETDNSVAVKWSDRYMSRVAKWEEKLKSMEKKKNKRRRAKNKSRKKQKGKDQSRSSNGKENKKKEKKRNGHGRRRDRHWHKRNRARKNRKGDAVTLATNQAATTSPTMTTTPPPSF